MNNEIRPIDFEKAENLFEGRQTVLNTGNLLYFIVFYTALNSILSFFQDFKFVGFALSICTIIDEIIRNAPIVMIVIGLLLNLFILSFFVYLAYKTKKKELTDDRLWAYKLALILYCIDTLSLFFIPIDGKIAFFIVRLFCIWLIWREIRAYKDYFKLEKKLYLPDWALTNQSYVLFIKKEDFELQSDEASQIIFYKKARKYQEDNKPVNAIEYYSKAIRIWECVPITTNKDKDWYAMSLMNRAILERKLSIIESRNSETILKDLILAYDNLKTVINEDAKIQKKNEDGTIQKLNIYDFVSEYFTQCSYYLLLQLRDNLLDVKFVIKYGKMILGIKPESTEDFLKAIMLDSFKICKDYKINIWENTWTLRILTEISPHHSNIVNYD